MHLLACKLIRVGWVIHGLLFKVYIFYGLEALAMLLIDLLKLNNTTNTCLINLNIILYYS